VTLPTKKNETQLESKLMRPSSTRRRLAKDDTQFYESLACGQDSRLEEDIRNVSKVVLTQPREAFKR